jgi:hypothetical protein
MEMLQPFMVAAFFSIREGILELMAIEDEQHEQDIGSI